MNDSDISDPGNKNGFWVKYRRLPHYYGDNVRRLFLAVAFITLITLPFFKDIVRAPIMSYVAAMIFLCVVAGFTNPDHRWVVILNVVIAIYGIFFFEAEAVNSFTFYDSEALYFWTNQLIAFLFLVSLYYAAKTERGTWFRKKRRDEDN